MKSNIIYLTKNVQEIRKFVLGFNSTTYDFSPSMQIPLSIKNEEGTIKVGNDRQKLYRLSGGMIKTSNGNYIDIDEILIPESALISFVRETTPITLEFDLIQPGPRINIDFPHNPESIC